MATKVKDRPKANAAYDADFSRWLNEQAALIRSGRFSEVDAPNVAEELEGMARSEFRSLKSALRILVTHMLKWDHQPERRTASWIYSIREQRLQFADLLEDNPSLRPRRDEALKKAYQLVTSRAAIETLLPVEVFPKSCPFDWNDLLDRPFEADSAPAAR